jgi:hypothetical protein
MAWCAGGSRRAQLQPAADERHRRLRHQRRAAAAEGERRSSVGLVGMQPHALAALEQLHHAACLLGHLRMPTCHPPTTTA